MTEPKPDGGLARDKTLRDYFAGVALQGLIASNSDPATELYQRDKAAEIAFEYADAMLKERKKP
jgi:hypothetical protein